MTTIHARQIQLTKMHVRKRKKVLYIFSNIFSHHIAHKFLPQTFDFRHFTTHIYPSHYTPLSSLPYAALHYTSLHFTSLHYTFLHFQMIFTSLHFLSLQFSMIFRTLYFYLTHISNRFPYPLFQTIQFTGKHQFASGRRPTFQTARLSYQPYPYLFNTVTRNYLFFHTLIHTSVYLRYFEPNKLKILAYKLSHYLCLNVLAVDVS